MSNVPPPPPPPGFPPAPPPPPPQQPGPGWGQAPNTGVPAGYVAYGQPGAAQGAVKRSAGLSKATIVMFWLTVAGSAFLTIGFFMRKSVWTDFVGGNDVSFEDIQNADSLVGTAALLQIAAELAAVIVLCLWSKRIADNAKARGVTTVSPGMAAGGWFIPIAWFFLGFDQLKKSVKGVNGTAPNLIRWQIAFLLAGIGGFVAYTFGGDINMADSEDAVTDILQRQGIVGAISTLLFAITAFFAMKAMKEIDTTVTGS